MRILFATSISLSALLTAPLVSSEPAAPDVPPTTEPTSSPPAASQETPPAQTAAISDAPVYQRRRRARVLGERTAYNAVYGEILGAGLFYSLNYDRRIGDVAIRVGGMYFSVTATNSAGDSARATWVAVPLSVSYLGIGSERNCLEIGAGVTVNHFGGTVDNLGVKSNGSATAFFGHGIIGFRHQPLGGGFFLRAGLSPIIGSGFWLPWPHVGLGGTF
jgi:hypothetical protein